MINDVDILEFATICQWSKLVKLKFYVKDFSFGVTISIDFKTDISID